MDFDFGHVTYFDQQNGREWDISPISKKNLKMLWSSLFWSLSLLQGKRHVAPIQSLSTVWTSHSQHIRPLVGIACCCKLLACSIHYYTSSIQQKQSNTESDTRSNQLPEEKSQIYWLWSQMWVAKKLHIFGDYSIPIPSLKVGWEGQIRYRDYLKILNFKSDAIKA